MFEVKTGEHGSLTLVESTTFIAIGLGETILKFKQVAFKQGVTGEIQFVFDFNEDPEESNNAISIEGSDNDKTVRIHLTNWNSPFGATLLEPFKVGSSREGPLLVLFNVFKIGNKGQLRQVTFNLYVGSGEARD